MKPYAIDFEGRPDWGMTLVAWGTVLIVTIILLAVIVGAMQAEKISPAGRVVTGEGVRCEDRTRTVTTVRYDPNLKQTVPTTSTESYVYCAKEPG